MLDIASQPPWTDPFAGLASYRGPVSLPGSRRQVWWTGRVAIGLRYQPSRPGQSICAAERWIQEQLLRA